MPVYRYQNPCLQVYILYICIVVVCQVLPNCIRCNTTWNNYDFYCNVHELKNRADFVAIRHKVMIESYSGLVLSSVTRHKLGIVHVLLLHLWDIEGSFWMQPAITITILDTIKKNSDIALWPCISDQQGRTMTATCQLLKTYSKVSLCS